MSAFTDDDVTAALTAYEHDQRCPHPDESWLVMECDRCMVTRMVAAVAPAIEARALREAADAWADGNNPIPTYSVEAGTGDDLFERHLLAEWLRARAEAMAAMSEPRPCEGRNANTCAAEGCFGESCRNVGRTSDFTHADLTAAITKAREVACCDGCYERNAHLDTLAAILDLAGHWRSEDDLNDYGLMALNDASKQLRRLVELALRNLGALT